MKLIQALIVLFVFVITASSTSCNNSSDKKMETTDNISKTPSKELVLNKMLGTWQSEDGKSFERWTKNEIGGYNAVAYSINGKDTSWNEFANIYLEDSNWVFENTVEGQNDGKAVKFVSSILQNNIIQFGNAAHDFPTDINYTVADANTLNAFIVGSKKDGGKDTIHFKYNRAN